MQPPLEGTWQGPNWSVAGFADQTVRQVVRISAAGSSVRIRLSNMYGRMPLQLTGATIGKAAAGASVRPGTLRPLTFGQRAGTVVPAGGHAASDPARLSTAPLERLTVTLYFAAPTGPATFHEGGLTTSYRAAGDHRNDVGAAAFTDTSHSWYYLTGVDVAGQHPAGLGPGRDDAVVAFGDSLTDGMGTTPGADNRYPDELAKRLVAVGRAVGVLNAGIGGNPVRSCAGESAAFGSPTDPAPDTAWSTAYSTTCQSLICQLSSLVFCSIHCGCLRW